MTTLDHASSIAAAPRKAIVARVGNVVSSVLNAWKNRREIHRLGALTDSELSDIGLRRVDLHSASITSFFRDPTLKLSAIAEARALGGEEAARRVC